jgi:predicted XRE-type DNA-binding protein
VGAENKAGHITKGDVLEDLGFTPEEIRETEMKLAIWRPLRAEIEARGLTQAEVAGRLQIEPAAARQAVEVQRDEVDAACGEAGPEGAIEREASGCYAACANAAFAHFVAGCAAN